MRKIILFAVLGAVLVFGTGTETLFAQRGTARAETLEVKLASPLPRNSPWGTELDRLAAQWNTITNGEVRLVVLHSTSGGEEVMFSSLSTNTVQAAVFTSFGLSLINPAVMTVSVPFLIRNDSELTAVMNEVQGTLEERFVRERMHILAWSKSGFVNIFSRNSVFTPDDLKRQGIASNREAGRMNDAFTRMGFRIVETSDLTDMGTKLNSGNIGAVYLNSALVAANRLQDQLGNMLSLNVAPVLGGIVINDITWAEIGRRNPNYQRQLRDATRAIAARFDASLPNTMNNALRTLTNSGLTVNRPAPAQEQLWYNEMERVIPGLLGTTFDRELYQRISGILARSRAGR